MSVLKTFLLTLVLVLVNLIGFTQPKREFRGVWIATVGNIDWPSKKGLSAQQQQQEFIQKLDYFKALGFNAVVVQIRPAADAFYDSPYEPWSVYLSGKQGQPPFPKYDPLNFMIEETHKRNMDFHAWFNPFRALVNSARNPNPPEHVTRQHPDWLINYGGKTYFDPGNPEARSYIQKVISDVVQRYDIDAVHIDDYFYPYKIKGQYFQDNSSFLKYGNGLTKEDWRRQNVNLFVSSLDQNIKRIKPWVRFGISPFGIWRNLRQDEEGSATNGTSCYDDLYSDVLKWMRNGWADYFAPQLYWTRSSRAASFSALLPWWVNHKAQSKMYIGLGVYNMVNAKPGSAWYGPNEILTQIRMGRAEKADGFLFYSAVSFNKIPSALADSLRSNYFSTISIPPAFKRADFVRLPTPTLKESNSSSISITLNWTNIHLENGPAKYVIYRFEGTENYDLNNPHNILTITKGNQFTDLTFKPGRNYRYVVTCLDREWNESDASNMIVK